MISLLFFELCTHHSRSHSALFHDASSSAVNVQIESKCILVFIKANKHKCGWRTNSSRVKIFQIPLTFCDFSTDKFFLQILQTTKPSYFPSVFSSRYKCLPKYSNPYNDLLAQSNGFIASEFRLRGNFKGTPIPLFVLV